MALRVLLADESSTIKKVFQLALQDFGVEVRSVNIGVDVAGVCTSFKPDIIFADVLLQKRNGYDVCAEIKDSPTLKSIPVVLMWSGFMELDEDKYQASHANARLEKPFDVAALRKLITDLVPRTQNQKLSQFLTFPKTQAEAEKSAALQDQVPAFPPTLDEEFKQVPIPKMKTGTERYRIDMKPEELDPQHIAVDYEMPADSDLIEDVDDADDEFQRVETKKAPTTRPQMRPEVREETRADRGETRTMTHADARAVKEDAPAAPKTAAASAPSALSAQELEKIIGAQSREIIESVVWKIVPDLAKQIIERELNKLLKERDSHPY